MGRNMPLAITFICLALMAGFSQCLEVEDELEIKVVANGTVEAVILDCPYTLGEEDIGLVVKWFHMDKPNHIYQWIDGYEPAALGMFKDRVDLEYASAEGDSKMHSSIRILNPTTELSGEYTCRVSTFEEEKNVPRMLVVYSRPSNVHVWAKEEGEDQVKVVCEVENVFPEPEVTLHMTANGGNERITLEGAQITPSWEKGLYDSKVELIVDEDTLDGPTHFECEVTISNTDVEIINKTHYEPRKHEHTGAVISGSDTRSAVAIVVSLAFLTIWRL